MKSECKRGDASAFRGPRLYFLSILAIATLALVPVIAAQSTGGRIRGTVSDPSGAAVIGAKVTLINEATNVSRDVDTSSTGEYLLLEVPVGSYEIDVAQEGFKKYVRKGIALNLNEVISVDVALQLGATAETVEVT
ncbi:MAG: carboxypeptidase regulatory-like domain-containing protein, partial [Acidobacteria bacterium]|nr:carboxypeptidase regulatory-like domain-containing protein [Acidobacteriota bacterium]